MRTNYLLETDSLNFFPIFAQPIHNMSPTNGNVEGNWQKLDIWNADLDNLNLHIPLYFSTHRYALQNVHHNMTRSRKN